MVELVYLKDVNSGPLRTTYIKPVEVEGVVAEIKNINNFIDLILFKLTFHITYITNEKISMGSWCCVTEGSINAVTIIPVMIVFLDQGRRPEDPVKYCKLALLFRKEKPTHSHE